MSEATITAVCPPHWEVEALGSVVSVRDVRELDSTSHDWLVFNLAGQRLPLHNPTAAAAVRAVLESLSG